MNHRKLVVSCLAVLASFVAQAKDLSPYMAASRAFAEKASLAARQHAMPRLTDADAAPLITTLSDYRRFLDGHEFTPEEMNGLIEMCHTANQIYVAYALSDLDRRVDRSAQLPGVARQTGDVIMQNTYAFQQELALIQPFLLRCMAKQLAPLASMLTDLAPQSRAEQLTDTRLARMRGMLGGLSTSYVGMFALLKDEQLSSAYKLAMLEALADVANAARAAMSLDVRKQVLAELAALDPAVKAPFGKYLDHIAAAMRNTACEGLCAIQ